MHTNYLDYARREEGGETKAKLLEAYNNWVCRVHCHKVCSASHNPLKVFAVLATYLLHAPKWHPIDSRPLRNLKLRSCRFP